MSFVDKGDAATVDTWTAFVWPNEEDGVELKYEQTTISVRVCARSVRAVRSD